jgi:hypothetical protein
MANVVIYHPETQANTTVPEDSVWHYRQSGWLLRSEFDENEALAASRAAEAGKQAAQGKAPDRSAASGTSSAGSAQAAGGDKKEK